MAGKTSTPTVKVGDTIDLDRVIGMVALPGDTVATTRGPYLARVEGTHTFYDGAGQKLKTVDVAPARQGTRRGAKSGNQA